MTRAKLERKEDVEMLDWLTRFDYGSIHSDYLMIRQPQTGQWLINSEEFQDWLTTRNRTLFCPGIPGAGKTVLTTIVIAHLQSKFRDDPDTGIAYIYCNFRRHDEQKIYELLATIVKQLAESQPSLPASIKDLYNGHKQKRTRPTHEEILTVLNALVAKYKRVFIVVDALDECQVADHCRVRFLSSISDIQKKHGINLFTTSRFIPEILDYFKCPNTISLEVRASPDDVALYIKNNISQLPSCVQESQELQGEIVKGICDSVDGM